MKEKLSIGYGKVQFHWLKFHEKQRQMQKEIEECINHKDVSISHEYIHIERAFIR